jgi:hypothetical protein
MLKQVQRDPLREWPTYKTDGNEDGHARAYIQSCPEKPSKQLWPFSVARAGVSSVSEDMTRPHGPWSEMRQAGGVGLKTLRS